MTAGWTLFDTHLGVIGLAWNPEGITRLMLPEATPETMHAAEIGLETSPPDWVEDVVEQVRQHVAGKRLTLLDVPLAWGRTTDFRRAVYEATRRIPIGRTMTYGALAQAVGSTKAYRAVGRAMATNPFPILVPCHRVLAANGKPGGFSAPGGLRTKSRLLEAEGARLSARSPENAASAQLDWVESEEGRR